MLLTESISTHPFVGHVLPPSVVDRLVERMPWEQSRDTPALAVMRNTDGHHDNTVQAVRGPGIGGRMFAASGREGSVYPLNPDPEAGKVYLGWEGDLGVAPHYFTHSGNGFVSIGPLDGPYGEPEMVMVPQVWAEARDPRPAFDDVTDAFTRGFADGAEISPPEDLPAEAGTDRFTQPGTPSWLHLVKPTDPTDSYTYGRLALILAPGQVYDARTSTFTDRTWDATGRFRHVDTGIISKDGARYWVEVRAADPDDPASLTSWPTIATTPLAAIVNQNSLPGTPHLVWWERGQAEPVLTTSVGVRGMFRTDDGGERSAYRWVPAIAAPATDPVSADTLRERIAEMERFWDSWSEAMNEVAEDDNWCEEYEAVVIPLGFPGREQRERDWTVRGWAIVDIEIDSPPSAVDRAVSAHVGTDFEIGTMTVHNVSVQWSTTVQATTQDEAGGSVGREDIADYLSNSYEGSFDVNDWGVDEVEED